MWGSRVCSFLLPRKLEALQSMAGCTASGRCWDSFFFKQNFGNCSPSIATSAQTHREALSLSPHLVTSLLLLLFLSVVHGQLIPLCWWLLRSRLNVTRLLTLQLHATRTAFFLCQEVTDIRGNN